MVASQADDWAGFPESSIEAARGAARALASANMRSLALDPRPQTSSSEVQRLIEGLAVALESEPLAVEGRWRFNLDDGSVDPDDAIEDMTVSLDRLPATWPIHLRLEPADPMFPAMQNLPALARRLQCRLGFWSRW